MYTFLPVLPGGLEWEKSVIKTIPSLVNTAEEEREYILLVTLHLLL